jgi:hypothetical protein
MFLWNMQSSKTTIMYSLSYTMSIAGWLKTVIKKTFDLTLTSPASLFAWINIYSLNRIISKGLAAIEKSIGNRLKTVIKKGTLT